MAERPIAMTQWSMQRVLPGLKTETRRVLGLGCGGPSHDGRCVPVHLETGQWAWDLSTGGEIHGKPFSCPYGGPGDLLYCKERMRVTDHCGDTIDGQPVQHIRVRYEADGVQSGWIRYPERLRGHPRPGKCLAYGGFKEACRVWLRNVAVWPERVQDITAESIIAEGLSTTLREHDAVCDLHDQWRGVWNGINARRGYGISRNPWVWVVRFERTEAPRG